MLMKIEIAKQFENPLLRRKELVINVVSDKATPSRAELSSKLAAILDTKEDLIVIDKIIQKFGTTESEVIVRVYEDENTLRSIEKVIRKPKKEAESGEVESTGEVTEGAKEETPQGEEEKSGGEENG